MNRIGKVAVVAVLGAAMAACTTTGGGSRPVDVTRYHLGTPVPSGSVMIEPADLNQNIDPEYRIYADAVAAEVSRIGFRAVPATPSDYIAAVRFRRGPAGVIDQRPPVSVGLGGGSFGGRRGGVGLGGGRNFGLGGGPRSVSGIELSVQIRRRGDNTTVWEGRAVSQVVDRSDAAQPAALATKMASALFQGFPGQSGITTTVK